MFKLDVNVRNERLGVIASYIAHGSIEFYAGTLPLLVNADADGTLLAMGKLPENPCMIDNAMLNNNGAWRALSVTDGRVDYFRLLDEQGVCRAQGDVGTNEHPDAAMIVDRIETKKGYTINVLEFILVEGNE